MGIALKFNQSLLLVIVYLMVSAVPAFAATFLHLISESGEPFAGAQEHRFTPEDGSFSSSFTSDAIFGDSLVITFDNGNSRKWVVSISSMRGHALIPGTYTTNRRSSVPRPLFGISGSDFGCGSTTTGGTFEVLEVESDVRSQVKHFAANFEFPCLKDNAILRGTVYYQASEPPFPPFPDQDSDDIPDTADNCIDIGNPDQSDIDFDGQGDLCDELFNITDLTIEGDTGLPIGLGIPEKATGLDASFRFLNGNSVRTTVLSSDNGLSWKLIFIPPKGRKLIPGLYTNPMLNDSSPLRPGLFIGQLNVAHIDCNRIGDSQFFIHEIVTDTEGFLERFSADFKQYCNGDAALHGSLRFNASKTPLPPPDQDSDGIFDSQDNCIDIANPDQQDTDHDGIGDTCDSNFSESYIALADGTRLSLSNGNFKGYWEDNNKSGRAIVHHTDSSSTGQIASFYFFLPHGIKQTAGPAPSMSFHQRVSHCQSISDGYNILEIQHTTAHTPSGKDRHLERFAADFDYQCEGENSPVLHGSVRYNASRPPFPPPPDKDADQVLDTVDNCQNEANPDQLDSDFDDNGDACDSEYNNTYLIINSHPDDHLFAGRQLQLFLRDGDFTHRRLNETLEINFDGKHLGPTAPLSQLVLRFVPPHGRELLPGPYEQTSRLPKSPIQPGLWIDRSTDYTAGYWSSHGAVCDLATGRFDILEAEYTSNGEIKRFAADFEQYCNDSSSPLRGSIRINASNPPYPVSDQDADGIIDSLDNCQLTSNAAQIDQDSDGQGNACDPEINYTNMMLTVKSGENDRIIRQRYSLFQGQISVQQSPNDHHTLSVLRPSPRIIASFQGDQQSVVTLRIPTKAPLSTGSYSISEFSGSERFHLGIFTPSYENDHSCKVYTGYFDISEIIYGEYGTIERMAANFEKNCQQSGTRITGEIHYNASSLPTITSITPTSIPSVNQWALLCLSGFMIMLALSSIRSKQ